MDFPVFLSGVIVYAEYIDLNMKQLGFSPSQIGLGDRFRASKASFPVIAKANGRPHAPPPPLLTTAMLTLTLLTTAMLTLTP